MLLHEAQARIKEDITQEQLDAIHPAYCLLDFNKDDFCKLVNAIGLDKWTAQAGQWARLADAKEQQDEKDRYMKAKLRLLELYGEAKELEDVVRHYDDQLDITKSMYTVEGVAE